MLGLGDNARLVGPPELVGELRERVADARGAPLRRPRRDDRLRRGPANRSPPTARAPTSTPDDGDGDSIGADAVIRPERFARLVTLASILIRAGSAAGRSTPRASASELKLSEQELQEDIAVLNVVNFGAGTYVLYAEIDATGRIEVDPEPYGDAFARPARLLPVEAKALIAAIDLIGEHIPKGSLASVRRKVVAALGEDPAHEGLQIAALGGDDAEIAAVARGDRRQAAAVVRVLQGERGRVHHPRGRALPAGQRPRGLVRRQLRPRPRSAVRHFRLDRIKSAR